MIVILHGWSDSSASFRAVAQFLAGASPINGPVLPLWLGDYISMDDDITFDDLADAMTSAWSARGLPLTPRSVDLVVHSTGALVARHWMTRAFTPTTNPIRRLVMLAPANFGSHLAHKGHSFVGRVWKGYKSKRLFHTGKRILHGLEMASQFIRDLSDRDLFAKDRWYGSDRVLVTTIIGSSGYSGIQAAANFDGSDGTVPIAAANLNANRLVMDFSKDPSVPAISKTKASPRTAFLRVSGDNHSTIAFKSGGPKNASVRQALIAALSVSDAGYDAHCSAMAQLSEQPSASLEPKATRSWLTNVVFRVTDSHESAVDDYFIEFFSKKPGSNRVDEKVTGKIQQDGIVKVHVNGRSPSSRSVLVDRAQLLLALSGQQRPLHISITASPDVADTKTVGYSTVGYNDIGSLEVPFQGLPSLLSPDKTLFVDLVLKRVQTTEVFGFSPYP